MDTPNHPARFNQKLLTNIQNMLPAPKPGENLLLDPFAGTGMIHQLGPTWDTIGIEIEKEWAELHPNTIEYDCLAWLLDALDNHFDAIVTSPCFGNRMADNHDAKDDSKRITYRHMLGRQLSPGSAAGMPWGNRYRDFHSQVWKESVRVLKPGGHFILHISDHIRKGQVQHVSAWHRQVLEELGLTFAEGHELASRRMRFGANRELRVASEYLYHFVK